MADTLVVFTSRSIREILETGGSQAWKLRPANAWAVKYLVCTRNRKSERNEGTEEHGTGFLIAPITAIEPAPENSARFLIAFDEWGEINVPNLWQFGRNPVHYADLSELGIDIASVAFKRREAKETPDRKRVAHGDRSKGVDHPLTIAEAKRGLAATFGVSVDSIEITIRG